MKNAYDTMFRVKRKSGYKFMSTKLKHTEEKRLEGNMPQ